MKWLVGDFETLATNEEFTYVWGWAYYDPQRTDIPTGSNISNFFYNIYQDYKDQKEIKIYFHNLKFDGSFIINFLLKNNFKELRNKKLENEQRAFTCLISGMGQWYSIQFNYMTLKIQILNSLNLLPFSVKKIAKMLNFETEKGEIDYTTHREENHKLTPEEIDYIKRDVYIVGVALDKVFFKNDMNKMTVGSNALTYAKAITQDYKNLFPMLSTQDYNFIKRAYKGGFCYIKGNKQLEIENIRGSVYDVNSMYPAKMYNSPLPYGKPKIALAFSMEELEKYENDLYIISFFCSFKLKPDAVPTYLNKCPLYGIVGEYLEECNTVHNITLTNIDFKHFKRNYEIYNFRIDRLYIFNSKVGVFREYIDKFIEIKNNAKDEGNKLLAKLMLNSLTGKFSTAEETERKHVYNVDGVLKFDTDIETKNTEYIPLTTFITAHSRDTLLNVIYDNWDNFLYCDTDSVHLSTTNAKIEDIDDKRLGAWKKENEFTRGRYLKKKCYFEEDEKNNISIVKCAGLSSPNNRGLNWDNFKIGTGIEVLKAKQVKGGVVLCQTTFKI